jgi:phosphatidylinositol dimannoside acyltransferase
VSVRDRAVDSAYAAGWAAVRALPHPVAVAAFDRAGDLAYRRDGRGVRRLRTNLARVVPAERLEATVRAGMRSYARYWRETFRLSRITPATVRAGTAITGTDVLDKALTSGRGVVLALPHCGNWEAAGVWLLDHGVPSFSTVAERLRPESLYDRFVAYREGLGMEVLPLTGGPRAPSEVLKDRLRAGRVVCLLGDRDLTAKGIDVDFFGATARMPAGPALLAATTGAALLPIGLWFTPTGWGIRVHDEVPFAAGRLRDQVAAATQQVADAFAADIAARPQDWHMLQRLWPADPAGG